jgi:hypothetical protein
MRHYKIITARKHGTTRTTRTDFVGEDMLTEYVNRAVAERGFSGLRVHPISQAAYVRATRPNA